MKGALEQGNWKSVQIMAGSIVEALLVDYLVSTPVTDRVIKDPLKAELHQAIEVCEKEGVLPERAAKLCAVVRSYRNLIHPGRIVRLWEPAPDRVSATVASTLVDMIARQMAIARIKNLGYTAEQIATKVIKDSNSISIIKHLLAQTRESHRRTLLLDSLPRAHRHASDDEYGTANDLRRIESAFYATFEASSIATRTDVVAEFVRFIKEADASYVDWYRRAFLNAEFISHLKDEDKVLVKDYLIGASDPMSDSFNPFLGLGGLLEAADADRWIDPYCKILWNGRLNDKLCEQIMNQAVSTCATTSKEFDAAVVKRIEFWRDKLPESPQFEERRRRLDVFVDYFEIFS
jgi:hypothetical protein